MIKVFFQLAMILTLFIPNYSFGADKDFPEAEIQSILKHLKAREIKLRLRGLFFASQTKDLRVFEQLVEMYNVKNEIRGNVYRAMIELNQMADGSFSHELLNVVNKEFERLKYESPLSAAELVSSFVGQYGSPDPQIASFVSCFLANIDNLYGSEIDLKNACTRRCNIYLALCGNEAAISRLVVYFSLPTTNKHDSQLVEIFISRKDPRVFEALIAEIIANSEQSIYFVQLLEKYSKAINKDIPSEVKVKMKKIVDNFEKEHPIGDEIF